MVIKLIHRIAHVKDRDTIAVGAVGDHKRLSMNPRGLPKAKASTAASSVASKAKTAAPATSTTYALSVAATAKTPPATAACAHTAHAPKGKGKAKFPYRYPTEATVPQPIKDDEPLVAQLKKQQVPPAVSFWFSFNPRTARMRWGM